ncbi:hypothetical protein DFH28DRAFT_395018 [Melampsora americana]|nr:hypothetical protein DFH28DRAFT_395018 [Melampsora americana]
MIQRNFVNKVVFALVCLAIALSEGQPSKIVREDDNDRVVETKTTTTVTKSYPIHEDDSPLLFRAENLVGVVFGAAAILIANLMLLMLYIRKRRRQKREAGELPKDKTGDQKTGWWWSKAKPKEEASEVKENRTSRSGLLFFKSSKPKESETEGNLENAEKSDENRKTQTSFLGGLFGAPSKHTQKNVEGASEEPQEDVGPSKVEKKSLFGKLGNKSKKSGKEHEDSGDKINTLEDAPTDEVNETKTSFFTNLKKKSSLKIVTDLEAAEKPDSPLKRLSKRLQSPGKLKATKDLKSKSKSDDNVDETAEEVEGEAKLERKESTHKKLSRVLFSPDKKKASKDIRRNSETKDEEKVQSPRKFKSVLQKFQQAADSNRTNETREAGKNKEEKKGNDLVS